MKIAEFTQKHLPKILLQCRDYTQKMADFFRTKIVNSDDDQNFIIANPKTFFNILQSNFLISKRRDNLSDYYELKTEALSIVLSLLQQFPLNAKLIYEDAFLVVQNNKKINFMTYLIKDVRDAFRWRIKAGEEVKPIFEKYFEISTRIFQIFCHNCQLKTSQLKLITNILTDIYYQQGLYTKLVGHCYKLLDKALQKVKQAPFVFCVSNSEESSKVKMLLKENRWYFSSGFTAFLWINPSFTKNFELFKLEVPGQTFVLSYEDKRLIATSTTFGKIEKQTFDDYQILQNQVSMVAIELKNTGQAILGSVHYQLSVRINENKGIDILPNIPLFRDTINITDFYFLGSFVGKMYSLMLLSESSLSKFQEIRNQIQLQGLYDQLQIQRFFQKQLIQRQDIIGIFNAQRYFQSILVNYINQKHYASFIGRISDATYNVYKDDLVEIHLPFLYFLSLIKGKDEEWKQIFNIIFKKIASSIINGEKYTDLTLFLLYFLEINEYKISQQNLNLLYEYYNTNHDAYYINFVVQKLDVHSLIQKGLKVDEDIQPFDNLIQKITLLFHLETQWKEKWNSLQGFDGWWSPQFFNPQNNRLFNPKDFQFSENRQKRIQWSVLNLVTKDYCKSFIQPIFITPKYADYNRYQKQYVGKQIFNQSFELILKRKQKHQKIICKKVSNSRFDKFKTKIFGSKDIDNDHSKKKNQQIEIKQMQTECLFIDILTVVQGRIKVTKQGFIIFYSTHKDKDFDHMCAKSFKNQLFYYFVMSFNDIIQIYKKRFNASNNAVYIKLQDGKQYLFHFYLRDVDQFLASVELSVKIKKDALTNYMNSQQPIRWIDKFMSNYEYLQWLNEIAGRNYNDITQYPVLPWVYIGDGPTILKQNTPNTYRDLSKNIGRHGSASRVKQFLEKYESNSEQQLFSQYHFGTHYSSSAIIFNFLIRIRPYSIGALTLQSGKFDCADRIFYSYCGSWKNATSSTTDIRQLIPQIYTFPEMFINLNNYFYGLTQQKTQVDNVILPQWSSKNPFLFVAELRKQLQNRYVSENINNWIDLIYGFKQRGKDAIDNMNIFYPLTYQNCIDLDQVTQKAERISFETQIAHFGQNPSQIIGNSPHPLKRTVKAEWQQKLIADGSHLSIQTCILQPLQSQQQKLILFNSVFEGKDSVLAVKFISNNSFFVLRRSQYYLFKFINKKSDFLSKQIYCEHKLEAKQIKLNLKELSNDIPTVSINEQIILIGGFYSGYFQIIFLKEQKYNRNFRFSHTTITAMAYCQHFKHLYIGDSQGHLRIFKVHLNPKQIQFDILKTIKSHDKKINSITINEKANSVLTCSQDGTAKIYNLYSHHIIRSYQNPAYLPLHYAQITTNPLYAVVLYSRDNSSIYVYSINGQFLDSIIEKSGFIYRLSVLKSTDSTECLVYMNAQKEFSVWELPFLKLKQKIRIRKDYSKLSCFQSSENGKILITGTEDGSLHIIANPESF